MAVFDKVLGKYRELGRKIDAIKAEKKRLDNDTRLTREGRADTLNEFIQAQGIGEAVNGISDGLREAQEAVREKLGADFAERLSDGEYQSKLTRALDYLDHAEKVPGYVADALAGLFANDYDALKRLSDKASEKGIPLEILPKRDVRADLPGILERMALNASSQVNTAILRNNPEFAGMYVEGCIEQLEKYGEAV